jgi:CheY-like chemotaxis protein
MDPPVLLCVDERLEWLKIRKNTLESLGYSVVTATDTLTAMQMLETMPIAAVLVEYKLEGIDAEALAFHVKQKLPNQPIILLSAHPEIPERTLWLVDDYLMYSQLDLLPESIKRVTHLVRKVVHAAAA